MTQTALTRFQATLDRPDLLQALRAGVIGDGVMIETPFGEKPLVYADYVASGRALTQIEDFIRNDVLPYYANSHTEASFCGATMTRMREEARSRIGDLVGADAGCDVVFTGSGATAGLNRLVALLDIPARRARGEQVVVLIGPYEHHSNILPWRESGAQVVEIRECPKGGPDMDDLKTQLEAAKSADLLVGSFSAASNVTGILTDSDAVTRVLKQAGALAIWDFAGGGPYVEMNMQSGSDCAKDAIVFSAHKFPGGPGASGVMVLRTDIAQRQTPSLPGGGTVSFVSPWRHKYSASLSTREEAGTPNVVGDIRAALVLMVKSALGQNWLDTRQQNLRQRALKRWQAHPAIELLGNPEAPSLPIFAFRIRANDGDYVHHQLFTRMLSDFYGIQARGGCACAGPYAHRLLGIERPQSEALFAALEAGQELEKPGWVRLNLSALMSDEKIDYILQSVEGIAHQAELHATHYKADSTTARFAPKAA
ncbi:aminotransferase class V-fold PLP-dependent enzyme [Epibacterium sp. SM1969]|uniref:Aminotransferase class V-fold PLP-dependent enzyme n=1 Tax=Tritonibacter aquimaris TaxID=2663379 RepID=A0A844B043_9RHOB|nr:aminotransferase class V-fold PLP-dependent enzyme [Tritonibacter aquimaris]MQY43924.1 aminotransferase class V-fold PLP-dependent enzyme [Tritonibacter aquimaris]